MRIGRRERLKRWIGMHSRTPLEHAAKELDLPLIGYGQAIGDAELIVVASFPQLLPPELLKIPAINLHQSLLPRHRGIDPLFWTYHSDDRESGTTVHWIDARADHGDIISRQSVPLARGRPLLDLYDELARSGSRQLAAAIDAIEDGSASHHPQQNGFAPDPAPAKRTWRVEFDAWPAERTWHFLRGIGATHGRLCRAPLGDDMPVAGAVAYAIESHDRKPGTWERGEGRTLRLFCPDGIVTASLP